MFDSRIGLLIPGTRAQRCSLLILAISLVVVPANGLLHAQQNPIEEIKNSNQLLVKQDADQLTFSASTQWNGWPASKAFDRDKSTSWFSAGGDAAALGTVPWLEVEFAESVAVSRVTVWGNRESSYPTGYSVTRGRVELYDGQGKLLFGGDEDSWGDQHDIDFVTPRPIGGVRRVRFISLVDQGEESPSRDIAIGEIEIE